MRSLVAIVALAGLTAVALAAESASAPMSSRAAAEAVAAMFRCGPPGGYHYDSWWRTASKEERGPLTQNFGHEYPNANMFVIYGDGDYLAETE